MDVFLCALCVFFVFSVVNFNHKVHGGCTKGTKTNFMPFVVYFPFRGTLVFAISSFVGIEWVQSLSLLVHVSFWSGLAVFV